MQPRHGISKFIEGSTCFERHTAHHHELQTVFAASLPTQPGQRPATTWVYKPEAANTVWSSWWWAVCRLKHVEPSINFEILLRGCILLVNSTECFYISHFEILLQLMWQIIFGSIWSPLNLRRRSAAAWLLGSRGRILLRAWMFVLFVCCVLYRLQSLHRADHSFRGVLRGVMCDLEPSKMWRPRPGLGLGFSYRASFICVTIRITNRCDFLYYVFISFFSSFPYMFRAFMGPSSGVFQAVVLCYHLVHAVLCWSSACVSGLVCGGDFGVLVS